MTVTSSNSPDERQLGSGDERHRRRVDVHADVHGVGRRHRHEHDDPVGDHRGAPVSNTTCARVYILVKPGTYHETVTVPNKTSAPPITLYSTDSDASHTVIVFNNASLTMVAGAALGTSGSATFTNSSSNFQAKNLTFSNNYVETGTGNEQAVALLNQGDRAQFENVRALGNQDTLYVKSTNTGTIARAYFRDSYVEGDTDFIFGRGTTVFDHCEIHTMGNNKTTGHRDRRAQHRGLEPVRVPVHQLQVHRRRQRRHRRHLPGAAVVRVEPAAGGRQDDRPQLDHRAAHQPERRPGSPGWAARSWRRTRMAARPATAAPMRDRSRRRRAGCSTRRLTTTR